MFLKVRLTCPTTPLSLYWLSCTYSSPSGPSLVMESTRLVSRSGFRFTLGELEGDPYGEYGR